MRLSSGWHTDWGLTSNGLLTYAWTTSPKTELAAEGGNGDCVAGGVADSGAAGTDADITTLPPPHTAGQGRARWQSGAALPRTQGLTLVLSPLRTAHGQGQERDVSACGRHSKTGQLVQTGEDRELTTKCNVCS